jgi:hypothetical protein
MFLTLNQQQNLTNRKYSINNNNIVSTHLLLLNVKTIIEFTGVCSMCFIQVHRNGGTDTF